MNLEKVEREVQERFEESDTAYIGFPWFYQNHLRPVLREAEKLAENFEEADTKIVQLGALLHDIGYLEDPEGHEEIGFEVAKNFLNDLDIQVSEERKELLNEIISEHGYNGNPESIEAKIVASADALSHLHPRFFIAMSKVKDNDIEEFFEWMKDKIERDMNKICLEEGKKRGIELLDSYSSGSLIEPSYFYPDD